MLSIGHNQEERNFHLGFSVTHLPGESMVVAIFVLGVSFSRYRALPVSQESFNNPGWLVNGKRHSFPSSNIAFNLVTGDYLRVSFSKTDCGRLGVMAHTYNPSNWQPMAEGSL